MDKTEALINIGINGSDNFGCQLSSDFGIPNYQYDCFNDQAPSCKTNRGLNHYENVCVGDRTERNN